MKKYFPIAIVAASLSAGPALANDSGCTIAQVMKTIHAKKAYRSYEYASDYAGEQGPPTLKQHENNDQYLFWIDDNGQTCPAIATYDSGECTGGVGVVKTGQCE